MTTDAIIAKRNRRPKFDRWTLIGWKFAAPGLSLIAIVIGWPGQFPPRHGRRIFLAFGLADRQILEPDGDRRIHDRPRRRPYAAPRGAAEGDLFRDSDHSHVDVAGRRGSHLAYAASAQPRRRQSTAGEIWPCRRGLARRNQPRLLDRGVHRHLAAGFIRYFDSRRRPRLPTQGPL